MPDEAAPPPAIQHLRISTQDLPHGDYVAAVRELLGRDLLGSDLRHADGGVRPLAGFRYHATLSLLGPAPRTSTARTRPCRRGAPPR